MRTVTVDQLYVKPRGAFIPTIMRAEPEMIDDFDVRRRRTAYRAHHRGTKELDFLIGRYADALLAGYSVEDLACFERFLAIPDPMLQAWIFSGADISPEFE